MMRFRDIELGGEFAISYRIGIFAIPILIFTVPLTSVAESTQGTFISWTFAAIFGTLIAVFALLTVDRTIWKNRRIHPVPNSHLFLVGGIIGSIKGATTEVSAMFIGVHGINWVTVIERMISSATIGTLAIPLIALMEFSWSAHNRLKTAKFDELAGIDDLLNNIDNKDKVNHFLQNASRRIDDARDDFIRKFVNVDSLQVDEIGDFLIKTANQLIRPLSHSAEKIDLHAKLGKHGWKEVIARLPNALKLGLPWLLAIYAATTARVQLQLRGLFGGSLMLVFCIATLYLTIKVFLYFCENHISNVKQILPTLFVIIFSHSVLGLIFAMSVFGDYILNFWFNFFWIAFTVVEVCVATLYLTTELSELDRLEKEYSSKYQTLLKFSQGQPKLAPTLARYLHGTIQSRLVASAQRIRNAKTEDEIRAELNTVIDNLKLPKDIVDQIEIKSASDMLTEILDLWSPFMTLNIDSIPIEKIASSEVNKICDLLNEALSNAFRHGNATHAIVKIWLESENLRLSVSDDGEGIKSNVRGLGSTIYDRSAMSWSLVRKSSQTEFLAYL
ncbi:MAG: hypothetical protein RL129_987 [Actinomycetota bacterium]